MTTHADMEAAMRRRARRWRALVFGFAVLFVAVSYFFAVLWSH
jgi:hypothetical protein